MHTLPTRQQAACRHSIKPGIAIARRIAREPNNEHELMTIGVRNIGIIKLGSLTFVSVSRKRLDLLLTSGGENLFFPGCLRRRGETRRQRQQPHHQSHGQNNHYHATRGVLNFGTHGRTSNHPDSPVVIMSISRDKCTEFRESFPERASERDQSPNDRSLALIRKLFLPSNTFLYAIASARKSYRLRQLNDLVAKPRIFHRNSELAEDNNGEHAEKNKVGG